MNLPHNISFPDLKSILYLILGSRDHATIDEWLGKQLAELDSSETTWHLTLLEKGKLPNGHIRENNLYELWRIEEWKTDFRRRLILEKESEISRRKHNIRAEGIAYIMKGLIAQAGLDEESARKMAAGIYDTRNEPMINMFTKEKVEWE